jgi:hypothetical protein
MICAVLSSTTHLAGRFRPAAGAVESLSLSLSLSLVFLPARAYPAFKSTALAWDIAIELTALFTLSPKKVGVPHLPQICGNWFIARMELPSFFSH